MQERGTYDQHIYWLTFSDRHLESFQWEEISSSPTIVPENLIGEAKKYRNFSKTSKLYS